MGESTAKNRSRTTVTPLRRAIFAIALSLCLVASACGDDQDDLTTTVDEETDVGIEDPPELEGTPDDADDQSEDSTDDEDQNVEADGDDTDTDTDTESDPDTDTDTDTESDPDTESAPADDAEQAAGGTAGSDPTGDAEQAGGTQGAGDGEGDQGGQPDDQVGVDDGDEEDDPAAVGRVDQGFPAADATDLDSGDTVDLAAQLDGGTENVMLWFWSPEAGPSEAEADVINRLIAEGLDLRVVAIGVGGNPETARMFRDEAGLDGATVVWDHTTANAEQYDVTEIPSVVLLDSGGDVIGRWTTLSEEVVQLLRLLSA